MDRRWLVVGLLAAAAPAALIAHEGHGGIGHELENENFAAISDAAIDEALGILDKKIARRVKVIETDYGLLQGLENELKEERIEFERKAFEEKKAFLASLRHKTPEERQRLQKAFRAKLRADRDTYNAAERTKRKAALKARRFKLDGRG